MLIPLKSTSLVLVMISNMFVPICNRFHDRQANSRKITTCLKGYTYLTPACADILEHRGLGLGAIIYIQWQKFHMQLSWFISDHFGAIHSWNVHRSLKSQKNSLKLLILGGSKSYKIINV